MSELNPDIAYNNLVSLLVAGVASKPKEWRYGQYYFNALHNVHPDLANKIRTTPADPFYNDDILPAFWQAIAEHFKA